MVVAGLLGGYAASTVIDWQTEVGLAPNYVIILFILLGAALGIVIGGIVGRELTALWKRTETKIAELAGADVVLGTVGLLAGMLAALLLTQPLRLLQPVSLAVMLSIVVYLMCAYIGATVGMGRRRELLTLFPALASSSATQAPMVVVLDTSVAIDGRFMELRRLGLLRHEARLPRFVLAELQTLADSADDIRRARGRRGLDLLATLPADEALDVLEVDYPELPAVDEKLMRLAADTEAMLVTVDHNLAKVAAVRGIAVLNINEVAAALRPAYIPGDTLLLKILKPGKEADQGVGYLEDGTMVVVADGRESVGMTSQVEVTSVLQTSAGRMIFARWIEDEKEDGEEEGATAGPPRRG